MRQVIEKSFLDWTRDKSPKVKGRGVASIVAQQLKPMSNVSTTRATTRCVWPSDSAKADSRYLSRRVWLG